MNDLLEHVFTSRVPSLRFYCDLCPPTDFPSFSIRPCSCARVGNSSCGSLGLTGSLTSDRASPDAENLFDRLSHFLWAPPSRGSSTASSEGGSSSGKGRFASPRELLKKSFSMNDKRNSDECALDPREQRAVRSVHSFVGVQGPEGGGTTVTFYIAGFGRHASGAARRWRE
jgi:hypothetical protein